MLRLAKSEMTVSALSVRTKFGSLLRQIETEHRSLVVEKRGRPRAVLLSLRDYLRLAAPEPEVLALLGEESKRNRTDRLTTGQIDRIIKSARAQKRKRA
jgi:prevent-host-death family protein